MTQYLVSWNKPNRMFRFRERPEDQGKMFAEAYGTALMRGTDNVNHRLHMEFDVESFDGAVLRTKADFEDYEVPVGAVYMGETKWRCCAQRAKGQWRMLDQLNKLEKKAFFAANLYGNWNLVWDDRGSHIFHQGRAWYHEASDTIYVKP